MIVTRDSVSDEAPVIQYRGADACCTVLRRPAARLKLRPDADGSSSYNILIAILIMQILNIGFILNSQ